MGNVESGGTDEFIRQVNSVAVTMSQEGSIPLTNLQPLVAVLESVEENIRELDEIYARLEIQVTALENMQLTTDRRLTFQGQPLQRALKAFNLDGPGEDSSEDTKEEEAWTHVLEEEPLEAVGADRKKTEEAVAQKTKKLIKKLPIGCIQTALAVPATTQVETNICSMTDSTIWNGWAELGNFFREIRKGLLSQTEAGQKLFKAASAGRVYTIRNLLDSGVDPNIKTWTATALSKAVSEGHLPCVSLLLSRGARPDIPDCIGVLPLHMAASRGFVVCMYELLSYGASLEAKDMLGRTALHYAATGGYEEAVKIILRRGPKIDAVDLSGKTPLHSAVVEDRVHVVKVLLEAGAKTTDKKGTPLYFYASSGEVKRLLKSCQEMNQVVTKE